MSDHGDYVEPSEGDWMMVIERSSGEVVSCAKVESVQEGIARLSDGSTWGAETGQPVSRKWIGHSLWPITKSDEYDSVVALLSTASPNAFAAAYGILLADRQSQKSTMWPGSGAARLLYAWVRLGRPLTEAEMAEGLIHAEYATAKLRDLGYLDASGVTAEGRAVAARLDK